MFTGKRLYQSLFLLLFSIKNIWFCYLLHSFSTHSFYYTRVFIQTMSSFLYIFISHNTLTRDSKTALKWKLAISDRNNDYFYTNWLKEVFLTGFKQANDVYLQHALLCEIFRKTFCEIFHMQNIVQNTVSLGTFLTGFMRIINVESNIGSRIGFKYGTPGMGIQHPKQEVITA